jgi:hypothetical protein
MTGKNTAKISKNKAFVKGASLCSAQDAKKTNPQDVKGCPIAQKLDLQL